MTSRRNLLTAAALAPVMLGSRARGQANNPIRVGVLTDMGGQLADIGGKGGIEAVRMAVEDFGPTLLNRPIEVISADHQNRADLGSSIATRWFDAEGVEMITDLLNSAVALGVQEVGRRAHKITMVSGAGTSDLTNGPCSPTGVHWTYDTYSLTAGVVRSLLAEGGDSWFLITLDYAFGTALEKDATKLITQAGGKVLGAVRHPQNTADFSSYLLQAQASGAKVIALANAGTDLINCIKQGAEFGIAGSKQKLAGMLIFITDVHSLGLQPTQGLRLTEPFYWDQTDATRAFSARYMKRMGRVPTSVQAGDYGATTHWLRAVQAAGTVEAGAVMAKMREMPIDDFMTNGGRIREDGRVLRPTYLFEVKSPAESRGPWDYYKQQAVVAADQAVRPASESACALLKHA